MTTTGSTCQHCDHPVHWDHTERGFVHDATGTTVCPTDVARNAPERTVWGLARLAGCADPATTTGPGSTFLRGIEAHVAEAITYGVEEPGDTAHEVADAAVPVYTAERWATFTDLAAWQEDPAELGSTPADMTEAAGVALYLIAHRLASVLIDADRGRDEIQEDYAAVIEGLLDAGWSPERIGID